MPCSMVLKKKGSIILTDVASMYVEENLKPLILQIIDDKGTLFTTPMERAGYADPRCCLGHILFTNMSV